MLSHIVHGGITLLKNGSINLLFTNIQYEIFAYEICNRIEMGRRKKVWLIFILARI
jgi:hypothetical protein